MSSAPGSETTRSPYHHGNLRLDLLAAARELSQEVGAEAVTVRETARRAGVSHAAAYHHFADKRDLLRSLAIEATVDLTALMARAADGEGTFRQTLESVALSYLRFARGRPAEFRFMFQKEMCARPGEPDALKDAQQGLQEVVVAYLRGHVAETQGGDADHVALALWSLIHGFATIVIETPALKHVPPEHTDQMARELIGTLLGGVAAPGSPSQPT
jgi:AcrR family transcriptional regulator